MRTGPVVAALSVAALLALTACVTDGAATTGGEAALTGDLTVFAAASLADALSEIGRVFESAHPGVDLELAFDGSSTLAAQIIEGAPVDVFVSADEASLDALSEADLLAGDPTNVATNELAIIVEPANPLGLADLADLADDDVTLVVCAVEVPCGRYAEEVLADAGVTVEPASYEPNVRGVASKVVEGEADAGIVYVTDVVAAGDEAGMVEIPPDLNIVAGYPAAPIASGGNPQAAAAFIEFLTGDRAQAILGDHGFGTP